eukprot:9103929-Heterocapsa_arctica.AAC.1
MDKADDGDLDDLMDDPDLPEDVDPEDAAEDPLDLLALEQEADLLLDDGEKTPEAPPEDPVRAPEGARLRGAKIDFTDATAI